MAITRERLEEIATRALHALVEDDEETAREFFETELELDEEEMEYFGIEFDEEDEDDESTI